jgi:prepilin-type N-terminal cleavage/methylation domain-containing protein
LAVIRARSRRSIGSHDWHAAAERRASRARRIAPLEPSHEEAMKMLCRCFARLSRAERGMTLLEIMIVLAILAIVMGLLIGPKVMDYFRRAKIETTRMKLDMYANQAFTAWSMAHPQAMCPDRVADLDDYMNEQNPNDAWGNPIKLMCGASLPPGARHIALLSAGPDGKEGTDDDLKSWEPRRD